jgi:hypothetical protein
MKTHRKEAAALFGFNRLRGLFQNDQADGFAGDQSQGAVRVSLFNAFIEIDHAFQETSTGWPLSAIIS